MYRIETHDGILIEHYEDVSLQYVILDMLDLWHEDCENTRIFIVKTDAGTIVATMVSNASPEQQVNVAVTYGLTDDRPTCEVWFVKYHLTEDGLYDHTEKLLINCYSVATDH